MPYVPIQPGVVVAAAAKDIFIESVFVRVLTQCNIPNYLCYLLSIKFTSYLGSSNASCQLSMAEDDSAGLFEALWDVPTTESWLVMYITLWRYAADVF